MIYQMLCVYAVVINVLLFAVMGLDKYKARNGLWRIPEKTLLSGTWLLGGVGAWLAMRTFRHKTKHIAFTVSAPVGAVLSLALMALASAWLLNLI